MAWGGGGSNSANNPKTELASLRGCRNEGIGCGPWKSKQRYGMAQPVECERDKNGRIGEHIAAFTLLVFLGHHREKKPVDSGKKGEGG